MKIRLLACAVLIYAVSSGVSSQAAVDNQSKAQGTSPSGSGPVRLDVLQDAESASAIQQRQLRKRPQVKQWSPPPEITVIHTRSR